MDSDKLEWDRNKWGATKGKGFFSKNSTKRQTNNSSNFNFDRGITEWRSNARPNRVVEQQNVFSRPQLKDEEKFWSRGGDVVFTTVQTLLNEMIKDEYSGSISKDLLEPKLKIMDILNNDKRFDIDLSLTLIKVILKDSEDNIFEKSFRRFMIELLGTSFATKRIDSLINRDLVNDPSAELLSVVVRFLKLCFETLPGLAYDVLYARVENLHSLVSSKKLGLDTSEVTMQELEELRMLAVGSSPFLGDSSGSTLQDSIQPPDDFRAMSVFPKKGDLLENDTRSVFLRENKYLGAYKSVDHYLDVQFRLMREDFVRPLREGVREFKSGVVGRSFTIRVYRHVRLMNSVPHRNMGILHNIQIDLTRLTKVNWSESKRFMTGALLCFSCDNFEKVIFATVAKRTEADIAQGLVAVKFVDVVPLDYRDYTVLESTNLFETYRYVLARLQALDDGNICMKDHLIYGKKEVSAPEYLDENPELEDKFRDGNLLPTDKYASYRDSQMFLSLQKAIRNPLNMFVMEDILGKKTLERTLNVAVTRMNESQVQALRMALTKRLAVIQGPPGTGKTFVGLEICRILLAEVQANIEDFGPILIVCYTNHALDQFLEGISKFTSNIIRVGGGCKSESVAKYSIHDARRRLDHPILTEMETLEAEFTFRRKAFQSFVGVDRLRNVLEDEWRDYFEKVPMDWWLRGHSTSDEIDRDTRNAIHVAREIIRDCLRWEVKNVVSEFCRELRRSAPKDVLEWSDYGESNDSDEEHYMNDSEGFTPVKSRTTRNLFKNLLKKQTRMSPKEAKSVTSLDDLLVMDRWRLYRYWRFMFTKRLKETTCFKEDEYDELSKRLGQILLAKDEDLMASQDIIGMTTTGAAKYGEVLARIKCKIVIVEEAAEVLEAHVVAALDGHCQHLILIGDHKQLRPSPAVYELAKKYGLDLSLFERLIINGLEYKTLSTQHRMRPDIADLLRFIYPGLQDDPAVTKYPNVPAMATNLYFFNHFEPEQASEDTASYSNEYEAALIVGLCRHLLGNGVGVDRMTILTLYSGQYSLVKSLLSADTTTEAVRVSVVDNYQGEENDVILLSLVRSNVYDVIGFLAVENRICVSLSRAKHGLYVFGNFDLLCSRSDMWRQMCQSMNGRGLIGKALDMRCQNHPDKRLQVSGPMDFAKYPDHGCEEKCEAELKCGHLCARYCHFLDPEHEEYKCMENCKLQCKDGHPCPGRCHERCSSCVVRMERTMPVCMHKQIMYCYKNPDKEKCMHSCEKVLSCGHTCIRLCWEECGLCLVRVQRTMTRCMHIQTMRCHMNPDEVQCLHSCERVLPCEHKCKKICWEECSPCVERVQRPMVGCEHKQITCCYKDVGEVQCMNRCEMMLSCGHKCTRLCWEDCKPCVTLVKKKYRRCGHIAEYHCQVQYGECNHTCDHALDSGKMCKGLCGDCFTSGAHRKCYGRMSMVEDVIKDPHTLYDYPCTRDVKNECAHVDMSEDIPLVCTSKCGWRCKHAQCTMTCHEPCDRGLCNEACDMTVTCVGCGESFPCYGLCGEKCVEVCTGCDNTISQGSQYITLWTCKHTFEVSSLDRHMFPTNGYATEVAHKTCPSCGTIITRRSCFRYMKVVRDIRRDIEQVKTTIAAKIATFHACTYYRILVGLKDLVFPLFKHYNLKNYFLVDDDEKESCDSLYHRYFNDDIPKRHVLIYKYQCSVILLYRIYKGLHDSLVSQSQSMSNIPADIGRLIEWLNPVSRNFDEADMRAFSDQYKAIRNSIGRDNDSSCASKVRDVNATGESICDKENVIGCDNVLKKCEKDFSLEGKEVNLVGCKEDKVTEFKEGEVAECKGDEVTEYKEYELTECKENEVTECKEDDIIASKEDNPVECKENEFIECKVNYVECKEEEVIKFTQDSVTEYKDNQVECKENEVTEAKDEKLPEYKKDEITKDNEPDILECNVNPFVECVEDTTVECKEERVVEYEDEFECKEDQLFELDDDYEDGEWDDGSIALWHQMHPRVPSEKSRVHYEEVLVRGHIIMRGFESLDRLWFKCVNGHVYNPGQCFQSPPQCPACYDVKEIPDYLLTE